jgi:WD40 repeat protein
LYSVEPLDLMVEALTKVSCTVLKGCVKIDNVYAFITNLPAPFIFDINRQNILQFSTSDAPKSPMTCVALSPDKQFLAVGYSDGSIAYWSVNERKVIRSIVKSKIHKTPITAISFGYKNDTIFAGDSDGRLTYNVFYKRIVMTYNQEEITQFANEPVTNIKVSLGLYGAPKIGFVSTPHSLVAFDQDAAVKGDRAIFRRIPFDSAICFDMIVRDKTIHTAVGGDGFVRLIRWIASPNGEVKDNVFWTYDIPNEKVSYTFLLSSVITCAITVTGRLMLLTKSSELIGSSTFDLWPEMQNRKSPIFPDGDNLMFINLKMPAIIKFTDWKKKVKYFMRDTEFNQKNYEAAFGILVEIQIGSSITSIGLSPNKTTRRLEVAKVAKEISKKYISEIINQPNLAENLAFLVAYTNSLNISREIVTFALPLFKDAGKLEEFFDGIFYQHSSGRREGSPSSECGQYVTTELASEFFQYAESKGILAQAEDTIASLRLDQSQEKSLLELAREKNMITLQKKILTVFYKNHVLPAQIYYKAGRLAEYCKEVFSLPKRFEIPKKTVALWLMTPTKGNFERLSNLIHSSMQDSDYFVTQILSLCPISYSPTQSLTIGDVVDAVLRVINEDSYESVRTLISIILPIIYSNKLVYSGASLKNVIMWILAEVEHANTREYLLSIIVSNYPDLIKNDVIERICQLCGFVDLAKKIFLPKKEYTLFFKTCISNPIHQMEIFRIIEENHGDKEILLAINDNISSLLKIDSRETVRILKAYFNDMLATLKTSLKGIDRVTLLSALYNSRTSSETFDDEFLIDLFEGKCIQSKRTAISFLRSIIYNDTFDKDKALKIAEKYNVIDCIIEIHLHNDNKLKAFELIGKEIESSLLEFIESDFNTKVEGIDHLNELPEIDRALSAIQCAINLLLQFTEEKESRKRWVETYLAFQFPLYHVKSASNGNIKSAITYLFTYFVVSSLNHISSTLVFACLSIYFCAIEPIQYRKILNAIFSRLDYQVMLNSCVEEMLVDDCINLSDKALQTLSRGYQTDFVPTCAVCNQPIKKSYDIFQVFPCGHCIHENDVCGHHERCIICTGTGIAVKTVDSGAVTKRNFRNLMKRFDFAVTNSYENIEDDDVYISPVRVAGLPVVFDDGSLEKIPNKPKIISEDSDTYSAINPIV